MAWFKKKVKDEDVIPSGTEENMKDAESCVTAIKDFIENPDEEHKEAALQALDGLTRFLQAEARETDTADEDVVEEEETVEEKVEDAKTQVIKRYNEVLPFIANGTISPSEINDSMTPCDIKALILRKVNGAMPSGNLDKAFKDFKDSYTHPNWSAKAKPVAQNVLDAAIAEIDEIGTKKEK